MGFEDDGDGFDAEEIEVNIDPREEKLEALGIDRDAFEEALLDALEDFNDAPEADETDDLTSPLEEVPITIGGRTYRLGDLAVISVEGEDAEDEE